MRVLCFVTRNAYRRLPGARPEGGATRDERYWWRPCRRMFPTPLVLPAVSAGRYLIDRYTLRNRYLLRPSFEMMA